MKLELILTDDNGDVFEGEATLTAVNHRSKKKKTKKTSSAKNGRSPAKTPKSNNTSVDFELPLRAFAKQHIPKSISGAKKFTLLLARLAKGKVGAQKSLKEIEKAWNAMKAPMGGAFNPAHTTRAKDYGWVDTLKPGSYILRPSWKKALKHN